MCISWTTPTTSGASRLTPALIPALQKLVDNAGVIVGFNFKFDLHWLRSVGLKLTHKPFWDCQNGEFVASRQKQQYPSLEDSCVKYGLGHKIDVIKLEYWDKGIDTDQIPWPILKEYAIMDTVLTLKLYYKLKSILSPGQLKLLEILNEDLKVLAEMEYHGLLYDEALCKERGDGLQKRIDEIRGELQQVYPDVPINFASGDQLSAFLYGGSIKQTVKEHVGFYKTGAKAGLPKYGNKDIIHTLPRLYTPLKGSELAKEGYFATNEDTLLKLKGKQGPLKMLLELSKLEKLNGTYYQGIPKLNGVMNWKPNMLHGSLNQTVAETGRLSSTKPNLQNFASELQDIFVSRYASTV